MIGLGELILYSVQNHIKMCSNITITCHNQMVVNIQIIDCNTNLFIQLGEQQTKNKSGLVIPVYPKTIDTCKVFRDRFSDNFLLDFLERVQYIFVAIRYLSNSVQMSSVNLRENVEKTLAIKEFKRDYSLMAKFFFYSRS